LHDIFYLPSRAAGTAQGREFRTRWEKYVLFHQNDDDSNSSSLKRALRKPDGATQGPAALPEEDVSHHRRPNPSLHIIIHLLPQNHNYINNLHIKMKTAILASLVAATAAFAPNQQKAASTSLNAFEDALGAQPPLGFYDPLGLVADGNQETFDRLRFVELKHGRISMLAFLGQITTRSGVHLPGCIDKKGTLFSDIPEGWSAIQGPNAMPGGGLAQLLVLIAILELSIMKDVTGSAEFPGDFRNGYIDYGWDKFDEDTKLKKRAIELNNGRAAMTGILGLMVHEQLGGSLPIVGEL
jgi:hypothetical protein